MGCAESCGPVGICKGAEQPGTSAFHPPVGAPGSRRTQNLCDVCGRVKRSNHNCKGAQPAEKPCVYCVRAGEPCVRHGGERSSVRASRRYQERQKVAEPVQQVQVDERVANTLPAPVPVIQSDETNTGRPALPAEADRELAAIGTILAAVDGLAPDEVKRAFAYVADRKGIKQETES